MGCGEVAGLINQSLLLRKSRGNGKAAIGHRNAGVKAQECEVQC